jgi:1-deoxy-D-xylulose-5-phosphate synthase
LAGKLPQGKGLQKFVSRLDEGLKKLFMPGGLFEDLGLRYIGPVDGHNLEQLIDILKAVKQIPGPVLLHALTNKGHGWEKSAQDAIKWHASNPFDIESGKLKAAPSPVPSLTKVFGDAILEIAREDKRVIGITAAMPEGCGLHIMQNEMPDRVYDVGIAEQYATTFAAGAACDGLKPVVAVYSSFLQRAFDQVIHDVAIQHLNVTFVLDRSGLVGADGPTHHGGLDLSYLTIIPEMVVVAPSDEKELRNLLYTALKYDKGPIALRYPRGNASAADEKLPFEVLPIGMPRIIEEGEGLLILSCGHMLANARKAVEALKKDGIRPTLVDARTVKPLDAKAYGDLFARHRAILTLEDNVLHGGYGAMVAELMESGPNIRPIRHIALPDEYVTHGDVPNLYRIHGMDDEGIRRKAMELMAVETATGRLA